MILRRQKAKQFITNKKRIIHKFLDKEGFETNEESDDENVPDIDENSLNENSSSEHDDNARQESNFKNVQNPFEHKKRKYSKETLGTDQREEIESWLKKSRMDLRYNVVDAQRQNIAKEDNSCNLIRKENSMVKSSMELHPVIVDIETSGKRV